MKLVNTLFLSLVSCAAVNNTATTSENPTLKSSVDKSIQGFNQQKSQNLSARKRINVARQTAPASKMHTEAEARSLINYASAAYCNKDKLVNWSCANCKGPAAGSTETTYFQDNSVASAGFATVNNGQKQIIFSYRGTNEISNWLYNLDIDLIPAGLNGTYKDAELHEGFNDMTNSLFEQTKNTLKNFIGKYPDYKLVFTGHSLGGAVAALTAFKLGEQKLVNWEKLNVITYGQPRVGNPKFANYLVSKPWKFTRITAYSDIVAISPGMSMGYYHNQHNMHINSRGKTIICSVYKEDDACIDDFYIPSIDAHFNYWNLKINSECV